MNSSTIGDGIKIGDGSKISDGSIISGITDSWRCSTCDFVLDLVTTANSVTSLILGGAQNNRILMLLSETPGGSRLGAPGDATG